MNEKDEKILELEKKVAELTEENKKLEETVQWMHDLIWQMVRKQEEGKEDLTNS